MCIRDRVSTTEGAEQVRKASSQERRIDDLLKTMKFRMRNMFDRPGSESILDVTSCIKELSAIKLAIKNSSDRLTVILEEVILPASSVYMLTETQERFSIHIRQLDLLLEELSMAQRNEPVKPLAAIVITKQPFPCTVKQGKILDEAVEVNILTGAKTDITATGKIRAEMVNEEIRTKSGGTRRKGNRGSVANNEETIKTGGSVTFKRLKFPNGTRMKPVNMKFSAQVHLNSVPVRLESDESHSFIVMTNHGQRVNTEGKLLNSNTFRNRSEISWALFTNMLQLYYIRATKQDPENPKRPLTPQDLDYLHKKKFGSKQVISQEAFETFWKWFGKILYKIRNNQKHILPLWTNGLIHGFISREDSERIIRGSDPHSFLIRFSDRRAGQFVIVKRSDTDQDPFQHYLIAPEDIEQKASLPDFLRGCANLWYILQLVPDPRTNQLMLIRQDKDKVLAPYYTKKEAENLPPGYSSSVSM
eukprot:TRINITY_DN3099_c0_g1_i4.p1 TRINITY_DN3099_c0_g1~~TRINITY_DN3099_c0_g1_i4.p1  ORF type:complete len:475 (-),score=65.58 TRINITY_DN3099_c0_g1_i4:107-1531(-)